MKLIIAGVASQSPELITLEAIHQAQQANVILVPRSHRDTPGLAEKIITRYVDDDERKIIPVHFPMTNDTQSRDATILAQLREVPQAEKIFFPVIGDAMLYSTGAYLLEQWQKIIPDIEPEFLPGVSAHSMAAACAKKFLAMSDEIISIVPGTADRDKIMNIMKHSDAVAIYKPTALHDIHELAQDFTDIIRVDFAGIPERESITRGHEALNNIHEYMSIILLCKN